MEFLNKGFLKRNFMRSLRKTFIRRQKQFYGRSFDFRLQYSIKSLALSYEVTDVFYFINYIALKSLWSQSDPQFKRLN